MLLLLCSVDWALLRGSDLSDLAEVFWIVSSIFKGEELAVNETCGRETLLVSEIVPLLANDSSE